MRRKVLFSTAKNSLKLTKIIVTNKDACRLLWNVVAQSETGTNYSLTRSRAQRETALHFLCRLYAVSCSNFLLIRLRWLL